MHIETLRKIRSDLFQGLTHYAKCFPDFARIFTLKTYSTPDDPSSFLTQVKESIHDDPELLIYIHLPYCRSSCTFCNVSTGHIDPEEQNQYVNNLLKEVKIYADSNMFFNKTIKAIHIGGGTPSIFSILQIKKIIEHISSQMALSQDCSITLEAHPEDLTTNKFIQELSQINIKRISIGCQTFSPDTLRLCNRKKQFDTVVQIAKETKSLGIHLNIDMMFGLPGQTLKTLKNDLTLLEKLNPDSIEYMRHEVVNEKMRNLYQQNEHLLTSDDDLFQMNYEVHQWIEKNNFEQSGYFTDGRIFPYRYYWVQEMPYLAFGSRTRSHTKTICYEKDLIQSQYAKLDNNIFSSIKYHLLNQHEQMFRSLFLNIQLKEGINIQKFNGRFHQDPRDVFSSLMAKLKDLDLITISDNAIKLTRYGRFFLEDICCFIAYYFCQTDKNDSTSSQEI